MLQRNTQLQSCPYELLEELHTKLALRICYVARWGLVAKLCRHGASLAAQPETVCALRNLLVMGKLLGSINPKTLHRIAEGLPAATQRAPEDKPPSLFRIFRRMSSPNGRRALAAAANVLESAGRGLDKG